MNPTPLAPSLQRKLVCEFIGSMFLVIAAISPIILFHTILGATLALAVITDAIAVGFILFALIEIFGRCAYFNPVVLLMVTIRRQFAVKAALAFIVVQFLVVGGGEPDRS